MSRFHRSELRLASLSVAALAATVGLLCGGLAAPANATTPGAASTGAASSGTRLGGAPAPMTEITDPLALLGRIAPELLAETRAPLDDAQAAEVLAQTGVNPLRIDLPAVATDPAASGADGQSTAIHLAPATTEGAGLPLSITLDDARGPARASGGITTYVEQGAPQATYAQPLADGIRLLTALAGPGAGSDFSYTLDLPAGSTTQVIPTGDTVLADATGRYVASLAPAWARDANGAELATSYSWSGSGNTLTQHVELGADTAFPVLLDPKWFYSYDFSTTSTGWPANHPKASDRAVDHLLHGCFNCWFPVAGASRAYPVDGAVMNLNASPFTIIEVPAPVKVQTANGGALQFLATSGHFDGAGSTITFAWYNDTSGYLHLYVHAMVMVDRGPTVNIANSRIAGVTWLTFWKRVADNANGSSGGGGV